MEILLQDAYKFQKVSSYYEMIFYWINFGVCPTKIKLEWNPGDTMVYRFPGNMAIYHIKIFSKDNFTFIGHFSLDTIIHDNYGGGTYTLDGDRYEENVLYAGKSILNSKISMIQEIINDTLIQKWPADENWKLADKYSIEKYIRLK